MRVKKFRKRFNLYVPDGFINAIDNYIDQTYPGVTRSQFLNDLLEFYIDHPTDFDISSEKILEYHTSKRGKLLSFYFYNARYSDSFTNLAKSNVRSQNQEVLHFIYAIHYLIKLNLLSDVYHGYKTASRA